MSVVLQAEDLARFYEIKRGWLGRTATVRALSQASFALYPGKTLAVVGESGCGKSTLARLVTLIEQPSAGRLVIAGQDVAELSEEGRRQLRQAVQIVFQNPFGSLNPRKKIGAILEEPLVINKTMSASERRAVSREMMAKVGLRPEHYNRYPHMFSGGQRQRIAVGRAIATKPELVIADEPVSALDVTIQAQILKLILELVDKHNLTMLFISHDLSVVRYMSDRIAVMHHGKLVETGETEPLFAQPHHDYTRRLLSAIPLLDGPTPAPAN